METKLNEAVQLEVNDQIAVITLNEPKKMNALSREISSGLARVLDKVKNDSSIRAVILTGNGKAFCAGGDISSFPNISNAGVARNFMISSQFYRNLVNLEKPTIAAVNGYAIGAGLSLAVSCDIVIAAKDSTFGMGFNKMGLVPDLGALFHLPRIVGIQRAKELVYSSRTFTAEEAIEYGICLEVVNNDELLNRAKELASSLVENTGYSLGLTKSILNQSFELSLEQILNMEAMAQAISFTTEDHEEAVKAFMEKRKPVFKGQ